MATSAHTCARLFKRASTHGGHDAANTVIHPHTLRQEESNSTSLHRWAGEGNTLVPQLVSMRKWGGVGLGVGGMYAVCRLNLFHMTGLGLFLSTALLSSKESGSVTTWLPKRHRGERGGMGKGRERKGEGVGGLDRTDATRMMRCNHKPNSGCSGVCQHTHIHIPLSVSPMTQIEHAGCVCVCVFSLHTHLCPFHLQWSNSCTV